MPAWNKPNQSEPEREEASYHGQAIGQTLTSTRLELMAWIRVLALPFRSCYATDSAAMLGKAVRLIAAARNEEFSEAHRSNRTKTKTKAKNPFKKPWGLQTDGDLWQQAWIPIVQRGAANQSLRKVKGHATNEDRQQGLSNNEDKEGNDKSDKLADDGVEHIQGRGLVKLASWISDRHDMYGAFMKRVHKMITGVLIAEKERRTKDKQVSKAVMGYDPDKWIQSDVNIRSENQNEVDYSKLDMPPPIRGKDKFSHCQQIYADIHNFMTHREWAYAHPEGNASGMTWIEMFALFDTAGYRTSGAQHIRNEDAYKRAISRRDKTRAAKEKKFDKKMTIREKETATSSTSLL